MLLPHAPQPDELSLWPFFKERITDDDLQDVAGADQGYSPLRYQWLRDMMETGRPVRLDEFRGKLWLEECFGLMSHTTRPAMRIWCTCEIIRGCIHHDLQCPDGSETFGWRVLIACSKAANEPAPESIAAFLSWATLAPTTTYNSYGKIPPSLCGLVQVALLADAGWPTTEIETNIRAIDAQFKADIASDMFAKQLVWEYRRANRDLADWTKFEQPCDAAALIWQNQEVPWVVSLELNSEDSQLRDLALHAFEARASESPLIRERIAWLKRPWMNWSADAASPSAPPDPHSPH
jgi:hypothetical protein